MINRDDLPATPEWATEARPAIDRLESRNLNTAANEAERYPWRADMWANDGDQN